MGFVSCSEEDEPKMPVELTLSTNEKSVTTDQLTYEFDVISGNGDYQVEVANSTGYSQGKATVNGNHITVELVDRDTYLTITDKEGKQKDLTILTTHPSLECNWYQVLAMYGCTYNLDCEYGTGEYSITEYGSKHAVSLTLDEKHKIGIKTLLPNTSEKWILNDSRGSVLYLDVAVSNGRDITSSEPVEFKAKKAEQIHFPLKFGEGHWSFVSQAEKNPFILIMKKPKEWMPMCFKSKYGKRTNRCRSFWKTPQETALTLPSFHNNSAKTTYRKPASQKPAFSFRTDTVSGKNVPFVSFSVPLQPPSD